MKRRDFIKVTGLGVAGAATIAAPAIAQSAPEIKWRMTASWPKSLETLYGGADALAKAVGEATDNKFQIQLFAAGEITGHFYATAPNAVSVLRALVFGRIAGQEAVNLLQPAR